MHGIFQARILERVAIFYSKGAGAQSCPILCGSMDYSLLGSSLHGIFQARTWEWGAISYSSRSFLLRGQTCVPCMSCVGGWVLSHWCCTGIHSLALSRGKVLEQQPPLEQGEHPESASRSLIPGTGKRGRLGRKIFFRMVEPTCSSSARRKQRPVKGKRLKNKRVGGGELHLKVL